MRKLYILVILVLSSIVFLSCTEDDDFSSDGRFSLAFSSDTINFDTVFTTIGSATQKFKIYNPNNKSLVIESIELMNPVKSGFRMNIDGEKGVKLSNLEILKKDHLYGFVEVTVDPEDPNNPVLIRDSIKFVTNGNVQYLYLEVIGQDVYIWKKKVILSDTIVSDTKPILVYDTLTVEQGATLSVMEGALFYLRKDAVVSVSGTLNAIGSVEKPVVFRGDRFDNIEGDIPYDNVPGQWGGMYFLADSYNNHLENVHVRNAVRGMTFYRSNPQNKKAILKNTMVHNTSDYGVLATNSNVKAENCLFTNSGGAVLTLEGGQYSFIHCTIANYYRWAARQAEALVLKDFTDTEDKTSLLQCDFVNSIIYGSFSNELLLESQNVEGLNYQFKNSLIKGRVSDNEWFDNVVWNEDPLFKDLNANKMYYYDFDLIENSSAIDKADRSYSISVPYDMKGRSRLQDSNPDIGCYEWSK